MGVRKRKAAESRKEDMKTTYLAKLNNCPTSPRKMRLVADMVRGIEVFRAMSLLQHSAKEASGRLEKLLGAAISNFESKSGQKAEDSGLYIKEVFVDSARQLKRLRTAPQGRGYRIRKRSNHVTLVLDSKVENQ